MPETKYAKSGDFHIAYQVELSGIDHLLGEIQEFLTVVREAREPDRVLATVMFVALKGVPGARELFAVAG